MKNIYLVVTIAIAVVLILLGAAIFIVELKGERENQGNGVNQKTQTQEVGGEQGEPQEISKDEYERQAIFERTKESTAPAVPTQ